MLPRWCGSAIRTALGGTCGSPVITRSHQLSHEIVNAALSPGRSASRLEAGYVASGKFDGVVGMARLTCTGPPFSTRVTTGRPVSRHVREPALRTPTSAIPPCSLGTNLTCPATWRSAARHGVDTGERSATWGGFVAVQATAELPPAPLPELDREPELQPAAETASTASATTALERMPFHDYRNRTPRAVSCGTRLPACERGQARCSRRPSSRRRSRAAGDTRPARRLRRPRPPPPRRPRA